MNTEIINDAFSDSVWYPLNSKVLILGAGGIGSHAAFSLASSGVEVYITDADIIERRNYSSQLFLQKDIGQNKSFAVNNMIKATRGVEINPLDKMFDETSFVSKHMIVGTDNFASRGLAAVKWKEEYIDKGVEGALFIDGRLSNTQLQIFVLRTKEDIEKYLDKYILSDEDVPDDACANKQNTFLSAMMGGLIARTYVGAVCNMNKKVDLYNISFYTVYNSILGTMSTEEYR